MQARSFLHILLPFAERAAKALTSLLASARAERWRRMTNASAFLSGRDYAMPEDVAKVFTRTCAHRIRLSAKARTEEKDEEAVLQMLFSQVKIPGAI